MTWKMMHLTSESYQARLTQEWRLGFYCGFLGMSLFYLALFVVWTFLR